MYFHHRAGFTAARPLSGSLGLRAPRSGIVTVATSVLFSSSLGSASTDLLGPKTDLSRETLARELSSGRGAQPNLTRPRRRSGSVRRSRPSRP